MDEDTFYSILPDSHIQPHIYLSKAKEMHHRETVAALVVQEDMACRSHPEPELLRANSDWCGLCSVCPWMPTETQSAINLSIGSFCWMVSPTQTPQRPCVHYRAL